MRNGRSMGFVLLCMALHVSSELAAIITAPDDAPTIAAAVAAAGPGDTVQIRPGTYAERIVIDGRRDGLIVEGVGGRPLIAPGKGIGLTLKGVADVTIRGVDIQLGRPAILLDRTQRAT